MTIKLLCTKLTKSLMTFFTNYAEDCAQVTLSGGLNLISGGT